MTFRNEPIPSRKISDAEVLRATETIAYYAVQQAAAGTKDHVHLMPFDNLTQEQRRAVIAQLIWLALDVSLRGEDIWLDELIENVVAEDKRPAGWQDRILDRLPVDERAKVLSRTAQKREVES
jgi:hypothetical protein